MSAHFYEPKPIDTTGITLSPALQALTEKLAENAHDLWAAERIAQGWSWGPSRDDAGKKHPCLVPYSELSEEEKRFDRQTAMGTLGTVIALGYRIIPACEHEPDTAPPSP